MFRRSVYLPKKCVVCDEQYYGFGNNAAPLKEGRCCDDCHWKRVLPARINEVIGPKKRVRKRRGEVEKTPRGDRTAATGKKD